MMTMNNSLEKHDTCSFHQTRNNSELALDFAHHCHGIRADRLHSQGREPVRQHCTCTLKKMHLWFSSLLTFGIHLATKGGWTPIKSPKNVRGSIMLTCTCLPKLVVVCARVKKAPYSARDTNAAEPTA